MALDPANAIRVEIRDLGRQKDGKYRRRGNFYVYTCVNCPTEISFQKADLKRMSGRCRVCADKDTAALSSLRNRIRPYGALFNRFSYDRSRFEQFSDLTYETFLDFTQIATCHYCGGELKWAECSLGKHGHKYNLDRKDSNIGYKVDNLVACCWDCNETKSNKFTYKQFLEIGKLIRKWKEDGEYGS